MIHMASEMQNNKASQKNFISSSLEDDTVKHAADVMFELPVL